jgi:ketosteroid isomerase-like protein
MPDLKTQPSPQAVVDEHLDALNRGDWERLMAQYPADVEIFLPGGLVISGREQVGEAFREMVKPFDAGGLYGVTFTAEHSFTVGDTVNVQWRVDADFLKEPYRGADAYVTRNGLLAAQVSTFEIERLKSLYSNEKGKTKNE